jgi:hypothetical protein
MFGAYRKRRAELTPQVLVAPVSLSLSAPHADLASLSVCPSMCSVLFIPLILLYATDF